MPHRSRLRLWMLVVIVAVGAYFALRRPGDTPRGPSPGPALSALPSEATVKFVADGDTFVTQQGYEVRLLNIDAPEYEEPFSEQARHRLKELIGGKRLSLAYDIDRKDRHGRLLCHAWVEGRWVNEILVRQGLAIVYLVQPNLSRKSGLIAAQGTARRLKLGVWSQPPPSGEDYYIRSVKSFRFHRPGCKFAKKIPLPNRVRLRTRGEAFDGGLSPCRTCRP